MKMIRYRIKKGILAPRMEPDEQGQWVTYEAAKIEIDSLTDVVPEIAPTASLGTIVGDLTDSQIKVAKLTQEKQELERHLEERQQVLEETTKLLEEGQQQLEEHLSEVRTTIEEAMAVKKMADDVLLSFPNLRPFEAMFENKDPAKSVLEVWAGAMWAQLTKEVKADILLTYAHSLADLDSIRGREATVQPRQSPSPTQQPLGQDSSMAPQGKPVPSQDPSGTSSASSA